MSALSRSGRPGWLTIRLRCGDGAGVRAGVLATGLGRRRCEIGCTCGGPDDMSKELEEDPHDISKELDDDPGDVENEFDEDPERVDVLDG